MGLYSTWCENPQETVKLCGQQSRMMSGGTSQYIIPQCETTPNDPQWICTRKLGHGTSTLLSRLSCFRIAYHCQVIRFQLI